MDLLKRNIDFRKFWFSTAFSSAASNVIQFALGLYVLTLTGSAVAFASIISITAVPRIILGPIMAVFTDRWKAKQTVSIITFIEVIILLLFSIISIFNKGLNLTHIYIFVLLLEMCEIVIEGPSFRMIPTMVDKKDLSKANSIMQIDNAVINIIGPIIALFIYNKFSIAGNLLGSGIFASLALLIILTLKFQEETPENKYANENIDPLKRFILEFKDGIKATFQIADMKMMITIALLINFVLSPTFSVNIMYFILEVLKLPNKYIGMYQVISAIVSLLAPFITMRMLDKINYKEALKIALFGISISISILAMAGYLYNRDSLAPNKIFVLLLISITFCIITAMMTNVSMQSYIGTNVDKNYLGRVGNTLGTLATIIIPLGNMIFSYILENTNYLIVNLISLAIIVTILLVFYKELSKPLKDNT